MHTQGKGSGRRGEAGLASCLFCAVFWGRASPARKRSLQRPTAKGQMSHRDREFAGLEGPLVRERPSQYIEQQAQLFSRMEHPTDIIS